MMGNAMNVTYTALLWGNLLENDRMEDRERDGRIIRYISEKLIVREEGGGWNKIVTLDQRFLTCGPRTPGGPRRLLKGFATV
jgi:hypothetical protein